MRVAPHHRYDIPIIILPCCLKSLQFANPPSLQIVQCVVPSHIAFIVRTNGDGSDKARPKQ